MMIGISYDEETDQNDLRRMLQNTELPICPPDGFFEIDTPDLSGNRLIIPGIETQSEADQILREGGFMIRVGDGSPRIDWTHGSTPHHRLEDYKEMGGFLEIVREYEND